LSTVPFSLEKRVAAAKAAREKKDQESEALEEAQAAAKLAKRKKGRRRRPCEGS